MKEANSEMTTVTLPKFEGGLPGRWGRKRGEKWLEPGSILKAEQTGFADRLDVGSKKKKSLRVYLN